LAQKVNIYYRDILQELSDEVWKRFGQALLRLDSTGKLGVVVFQFPQRFLPRSKSKEHILECQAKLPQYRIAVEFRNSTWLEERTREDTLGFARK